MVNHLDIFNFIILKPGFVAQGQKPYAYPHFRNERRMQSLLDWSIWVYRRDHSSVSWEIMLSRDVRQLSLLPGIHSAAKGMAQGQNQSSKDKARKKEKRRIS